MLTRSRLDSLLSNFPRLRIGLVGDLFLDRYLEIEPGIREMSIETGLEAYQIQRVRNSPGALGTVMNNLAALGVGRLVPVTVIGDDGQAYDLLRELEKLPVETRHVIRAPDRLTPTYTKPMRQDPSGTWVELNRLDLRTRASLSPSTLARLRDQLVQAWNTVDGWIVLDQINEPNWGVVGTEIRELLEHLARETPDRLMLVDSRRWIGKFTQGTLKGNRAELSAAMGQEARDDAAREAARQLARGTGRDVYCTFGEQGILVTPPAGEATLLAGIRVDGPVDIVGAGDAATSGIAASLLAGATASEAAQIGNLVASITVQQLGTTGTASPEQVRARLAG